MHPWLLRLSWLAIPFTVGTAIADALADRSPPVQVTAGVLLWAGWAAVVVGLLVPRPAGLVGLRVAALAAVLLAVLAADSPLDWWVAAVHSVVMLALALVPETGEWLVNGTAYGYERRYLLRAPAPVLLGPVVLAAVALPVAIGAGPLLLAARAWIAGAIALVAGGAIAYVLARALHSMAMRWAVLVPAGFVVKDHLTLLDPVLFRRTDIDLLRRAPADTDALDLTGGALGPALELRLHAMQEIHRMRPVRRGAEPYDVEVLMFTPTRPTALLRDAATRKIRVE